jgi:hypothetical protein
MPQVSRLHYLDGGSIKPCGQSPIAIGFNGPQKLVGDANCIVRVLPGDREIGIGLPAGGKFCKIDIGLTLAGELDHPCDSGVGNIGAPREFDLFFQRRVRRRVKTILGASS